MIRLPQICLNFLDFPHRLGGKEILWGKMNFEDCKRIFEQAVVEALLITSHWRAVPHQKSSAQLWTVSDDTVPHTFEQLLC
jgi:hypothetical protein